ncbi:MAG: hypothetical protein KFF73_13705 [Cyclobacteriaceae bacterium]|nr:hypothetical protein [Cyclobacteriaceae bacterium]
MMDYRFLAGRKKAFWRYGSILPTSLLLKILIDLSFGLTYSNYQFSFNLLELAWIIFLMYFLLEGIRFINRYLDKKYPCEKSSIKRPLYQILFNGTYAIVIIALIRFFTLQVKHYFLSGSLIVLMDELTILVLAT